MSRPTSRPWSVTGAGVQLVVRLTPRGGRDSIDGVEALSDGRLVVKARVRAAPTEGEANAALIALLARHLRLPSSRFAITSGATNRVKTVRIVGDTDETLAALEASIA